MNIVFNVRAVIASVLFLSTVVIPKILNNLGLDLGSASFMLEIWWVFIMVFIAEIFILWNMIRNLRITIIALVIAIIIAYIVAIAY